MSSSSPNATLNEQLPTTEKTIARFAFSDANLAQRQKILYSHALVLHEGQCADSQLFQTWTVFDPQFGLFYGINVALTRQRLL